VYSALVKKYPGVANFESALQRQAQGLGDDSDPADIDTSSFDFSFDTPDVSVPVTLTDFSVPDIAPITIAAPDVPNINIPPDTSGAAGAAASSISGSTLASIAQTVQAVLPAALNAGAAVLNQQTAQKTLQTAQLQYSAAVANRSPLLTGVVTTANGSQYLAALDPTGELSDIADTLTTNILGMPLWAWGLVGLGAVMLAVKAAED
jgi:hypothetical protein